MDLLPRLLEDTLRAHVTASARLTAFSVEPTPERERDYGRALVQRYMVKYESEPGSGAVTLLVKEAPLVERRVMTLLTQQGQQGVPYSHALDLTSDALVSICQQDVVPDKVEVLPHSRARAVENLARIHLASAGTSTANTWLPRADRSYFEGGYVLDDSRRAWDEAMQVTDFASQWGPERRRLEQAATRFLADMDRLWEEGDSLTLIHADLHDAHLLVHEGEPYFIDWGQARYGSFYLDLPNIFSLEEAGLYRDALARLGRPVPKALFEERYRMASRYVAFKYMGYTIRASQSGGTPLLPGKWGLFNLALHRE